jgi:hypothetical protein
MFDIDFNTMKIVESKDFMDNLFIKETDKRYSLYKEYVKEYNILNDYYIINTDTKKYIYNIKNINRLEELKLLIKNILNIQKDMYNNTILRRNLTT